MNTKIKFYKKKIKLSNIYMSEHKIIKYIKIFGERNSGTNFLTSLIKKNIKDINIFSFYYKGGTGWKHGFPTSTTFIIN